jgi:hypothetical protein
MGLAVRPRRTVDDVWTELETNMPMIGLAKGIAHLSFAGGGMFIPARSPYDRQLLAEHVLNRVRLKGSVQVLVDDRRWLVNLLRHRRASGCSRCGCSVTSVCSDAAADTVVYCVRCAFVQRAKVPTRLGSKANRPGAVTRTKVATVTVSV